MKIDDDDSTHGSETFEPTYNLVPIIISNVMSLNHSSRLRSCAGYKLLEFRNRVSQMKIQSIWKFFLIKIKTLLKMHQNDHCAKWQK